MRTRAPARTAPVAAALRTVSIGVAWLAAEVVVQVVTIPGLSLPDLGARLLEVAPWHLLLFAGIACGVAMLAALQPLSRDAVTWLALGGGAAAFLGARVVEGAIRSAGITGAAVGGLAAILGIATAIALLAAATRLAAPPLGAVLTRGLQTAWTLGFVLLLDRIGPEIGEGRRDVMAWLGLIGGGEALRLLVVAVGLASTALPGTTFRALGCALALAPLALAVRDPDPRVEHAAAATAQPDVIVLLLDTLRADHVGLHDARGSLTPALDALIADSIHFPNAFAPSNWTRGSMPGVLASIPFAVSGNAPTESLDLLAEHLDRGGWHGHGLSANPLIAARLGWAQGFERFVDPDTMGDFLVSHILQVAGGALPAPGYRIGAITNSSYFRAATELRRRAERMLEQAARPTFLYVQAMDPHGPYLPPHEFLPPDFEFGDVSSYYRFMQLRQTPELDSETFRPALENFRQRYAASVRYLDGEVGALLEKLRAQGRYDEALIWVLADHGEAFGERGWSGHTGLELGPALLRVPLVLKLPKSWNIAPRVEPTAVSTYSLLPTTLGLLELAPAQDLFGEDLSALVRAGESPPPHTLFADAWQGPDHIFAAIRWPWKLVVLEGPSAGVRGLYDLAADPAEEHSLADLHPEIVAMLRAEIDAYVARMDEARGEQATGDVDAQTREMLRRLGYAD